MRALLYIIIILSIPGVVLADGGLSVRVIADDGVSRSVDIRAAGHRPLGKVAGRVDGQAVPLVAESSYPASGDITAILVLVDTSDPRRAAIVAENARQVGVLAAAAATHHRLGLARFDRDMQVLAPLGSPSGEIRRAAEGLRAAGPITQLYRHGLTAIDLLAAHPASRRVLIVFTDGLDEGRGFTRAHVAEAAAKADVAVVGLGFPASAKGELALQDLEWLARESGGFYAGATAAGHLPDAVLHRALRVADGGGRFRFDAAPFLRTEPRTVRLEVDVTDGGITRHAAAMVPLPAAGPGFGWLLGGAGVMVASILAWRRSHRRAAAPEVAAASAASPHAVVEVLDDEAPWCQGMAGSIFVIGRLAGDGTDMALAHPTVSRPHAEIRRSGGGYRIANLSATNPILVNGKAVDAGPLKSGDEISLGDVRLRFAECGPARAGATRLVVRPTPAASRTTLLRPGPDGD
ncbi:FHA domain-containing protein [Magnetospirillum sp. SS-4]|uniref:FHA domain-containing protein n=1 Tax=Magnetospirillum sp. SS-4 TaxID=2681465 RepID=UPI00137D8EC3|nr:FHA domain-containing protein [Magnetospirillum sp. SS-4]CAA7617127.1 exported hypothetical protein [Magnetospirillum sp. SS-4]